MTEKEVKGQMHKCHVTVIIPCCNAIAILLSNSLNELMNFKTVLRLLKITK